VLVLATTFAVISRPAIARQTSSRPPAIRSVPDTSGRCHGEIVSAIDIESTTPQYGPAAGVWRMMQNLAGVHHPSTKSGIIESFLSLSVGKPCSEFRRAESERVLRVQPFLASARVRAIPDSTNGGNPDGRVRIQVSTVDEVPARASARFSGISPQSLTLGDANVGGQGLSLALNGSRGHAYRNGFGVQITKYAILGRPYVASLDLQRYSLGHLIDFDLSHPFYTDLQRYAWHGRYRDDDVYIGLARPAGDPLALAVRQQRWEVGAIMRQRVFGESGIIGGVLSGIDVSPASEGVVVSDSGLVPDTGVTLRNRYTHFRATRPGVLLGLRVVRFTTVQGFNTLTAFEDLPSGVQIGGLVGRGLGGAGANDLFLSGSLYAGHASYDSFLGLQVEAERRHDYDSGLSDDMIMSSRFAWYVKQSVGKTFMLSDELSGGSRPRLPLQLSLGELRGGLRGYRGTVLAGAWRNIIRAEQRWVLGSPYERLDFGIAAFADGGSLWAGSAPYGRTVPFRASFGLSLLAAYPHGSRRLARIDIAIPTTHEGNGRWEVRFNVFDLTRRFWREPGDVERTRTGPVPSNLFTWPAR
jgi:hypothetical protein